jgi:hypothetical protein
VLCDITLAPLAAVADGLTAPQPLIYPPPRSDLRAGVVSAIEGFMPLGFLRARSSVRGLTGSASLAADTLGIVLPVGGQKDCLRLTAP